MFKTHISKIQIYKATDYQKKEIKEKAATEAQILSLLELIEYTGYVLKINYDDLSEYEANKLIYFFEYDIELDEDLFTKLLDYKI